MLEGPGRSQAARRARLGSAPARFYRSNGLADIRAVRELAPLPDTADEVRTIAKVLGATPDAINLREAASETRVKAAALNEYRVIHFATHGLVAGDLSGLAEPALVLTPPAVATEADDGLLTASEIAALTLNADWVVLSACNTAAGSGEGAEALSGLARAFFYAGARALLVSHWAVYSEAATELTTKTFAALVGNPRMGRAEAFRGAMLQLIAQGEPPSYLGTLRHRRRGRLLSRAIAVRQKGLIGDGETWARRSCALQQRVTRGPVWRRVCARTARAPPWPPSRRPPWRCAFAQAARAPRWRCVRRRPSQRSPAASLAAADVQGQTRLHELVAGRRLRDAPAPASSRSSLTCRSAASRAMRSLAS